MNASAVKLLAVDVGAESGRVVVGHWNAGRLALEELRRFPTGVVQVGGGLYTDVLRIWSEIQTGVGQAAALYGDQLASVGVDTWGVDCALLTHSGELLSNPRHYRDPRTAGMLERAFARVPREEIYRQTGNQFEPFNTLYQLLAIAEQEPELFSAAGAVLMLPDLLHYWLSGVKATEYTVATTTQCYDQRQQAWAIDLLQQLGLPPRLFQPVLQPGTALGGLRPALAGQTGCGTRMRVVLPASHDTGSAVTAVPVDGKNFLYISSGTWSLVGVELEQPFITAASLACNLTNEGSPQGRTRFLKIAPGMWLLQQCKQTWERHGGACTYAHLNQLAEQAPRGGALLDVSYPDFLNPGGMPGRIEAFCRKTGQAVPVGAGAMVRCILESLALQYRSLLNDFENVLGRRLESIHIIGGGSRNGLLNQMTADCTGRPVIAGPVEATAAGNLLVQALGLGYLGSVEEIRHAVRLSFSPETFYPASTSEWEERYALYRKICARQEPPAHTETLR